MTCGSFESEVGVGDRVVRGEFDVLPIVVRWNVERDIFSRF